VDLVCGRLGLEFDIAFSREDGPHKPSPEPIRKIARLWDTTPGELLMVGDYKWDVLCARNAKARSAVFVERGPLPPWAKDAEFVIRRLTEVLEIVDKEAS
jgi:phosphoglycolate phosphatase-like HAD superfamily hydrolase